LQALVRSTNSYLAPRPERVAAATRPLLVQSVARYITRILGVLGCGVGGGDSIGFVEAGGAEGGAPREETLAPILDALTAFRTTVRSLALAKAPPCELLALCDALRDSVLPPLGVRIDDRGEAGGALWKLVSAEEVAQEAAREAELRRLREEAKADAARRKAEKAAAEAAAAAIPLAELFRTPEYAGQFGAFDESGFPTAAADGQPLSKSLIKKLEKKRDAHAAKQAARAPATPAAE